jgi:ribosomal protein S18 acetylase RimI-like enzyme
MLRFRCFHNDDPPQLATVWNDAFTGRGSYPLPSLIPLERCIFAKPYFDPAGLIVAEENRAIIGFAHAGFGPNDEETALDRTRGVLCAIAVHSTRRRRGIGAELLRRAEEYLTARGTHGTLAGPHRPLGPFYFGLYGGSDLPGFLLSDSATDPFLKRHGYEEEHSTLVLQRRLDRPITVADPRFATLRRRYGVKEVERSYVGSWWQECVYGLIEPEEYRLEDKLSGQPVARALVWAMEHYNWRWNQPAVGVLEVRVRSDLHRQGLAKFLLSQILRDKQEQYYGLAEVQTPERNQSALALFKAIGFQQVDVGRVYRRQLA